MLPAPCSALAWPHPANVHRQEESRARTGMRPIRHVCWSREQEQGEASLPRLSGTWDMLLSMSRDHPGPWALPWDDHTGPGCWWPSASGVQG